MTKKEKIKTKKNKKVISNTPAHYNEDVMRMVKIGVIIIICFSIIYLVTAILRGEIFKKDVKEEVEIQNQKIMISESFVKNDDEYMVLYYDFTDRIYASYYDTLVGVYGNTIEDKIYTVDLSTKLSENYIAKEEENSNKNPNNLSELRIKGATLIVFKDNKVTKYLEGKDEIKNYLEEMSK